MQHAVCRGRSGTYPIHDMLCTQPSHFEPESCSTLGLSMDRAAVVVVSSDEESSGERSRAAATPEPPRSRPAATPEPPRAWRFQQWAPHEGWGLCRGLNGVCTLGENNQPANAGCDGLCDLCNVEDLPMLHRLGQGRLTYLLLQLSENKAEMVLARIQSMIDEDMATDLRQRMARARRRKAADRPRRGRRGPYKSKSSGLEKKNKKEEHQGNAKKRRRSDSASSQTPEFGSLKKNKRDDAGHRHVKKSPRDQIAVSLQGQLRRGGRRPAPHDRRRPAQKLLSATRHRTSRGRPVCDTNRSPQEGPGVDRRPAGLHGVCSARK